MDLAHLSAMHSLLPKDDFYELKGEVKATTKKLLMLHHSFGEALIVIKQIKQGKP